MTKNILTSIFCMAGSAVICWLCDWRTKVVAWMLIFWVVIAVGVAGATLSEHISSKKINGSKGRMKNLEDIQKMRYDRGCVVYNTNNYTYGIVLNGKCGEDKDPCSRVLELTGSDGVMEHTPPNRALIPTGRFVDFAKMIKQAIGEES